MAIRYTAPPGTLVYWGEATKRKIKSPTVINTSVEWDGSLVSDSFLHRYAEGDLSEARKGSYIVSYGVENRGGESWVECKAWLHAHGENRNPTDQELVDWTLRYGDKAPKPLKHKGGKRDPLPVKDPRYQHGQMRQIDGIWYMNDLSPNSEGKKPFPEPIKVEPVDADPAPIDPPPADPEPLASTPWPKPSIGPGIFSERRGDSMLYFAAGPLRRTEAEALSDLALISASIKK